MPFVTLTITSGFSVDQKKDLLQRSSDAVIETLKAPLSSVRIVLHELPHGHHLCVGSFDTPMVLYEIDLLPGRTEAAKAALILALSKVAHQATGISEEEVRTRLCEFPSSDMGMANGQTAKQAGR